MHEAFLGIVAGIHFGECAEFGVGAEDQIDATACPLQIASLAGGIYDRDLGFVRFGARDYDPLAGRWVSKDAQRLSDGANIFAYVHSDPINYIDPKGNYAIPGLLVLAAVLYIIYDTVSDNMEMGDHVKQTMDSYEDTVDDIKKMQDARQRYFDCLLDPSCTDGQRLEDEYNQCLNESLKGLSDTSRSANEVANDYLEGNLVPGPDDVIKIPSK